ncbi:thiamine pyrophosphate-binding protein [Kutzneria buriramensis]|uniref:Acetolactate synthase-1/2/3 large subunit n=1 Tax=Kutzneria buriramensis TaxID=1045776 RepID=A0A3E0HHX0_9PSEU|nr:thiamine pyrophosphate-binding protein [Kutzneria buriramensis]REH46041.1 acetolactate synthase-1/2/3 large subunit [Kutzneria buriramensis]
MKATGGAALIAALAAHDVRTVFGIPGTHNLPAFAAMADHGVRVVPTRHEQGAGYAADGYARITGRPSVVLTTTGPGILNAAAAAAQAYSDSVPVLFIAPGMPTTHPPAGDGHLHEVRDQYLAMASVVGHAQRVGTVEEVPVAVAQACAAVTRGRPRPAYLEIPLDLLDRAAEVTIAVAPRSLPDRAAADAVAAAGSVLAAAERPVIIVGGGASAAAQEVRAVAEALGAPVFCTANGKGIVPYGHPLLAGVGVQHPVVAETVGAADCVLALGTELATADWWHGFPRLSGRLIRVDVDPVHRNAPADIALAGDCATVLGDLLPYLNTGPAGGETAQQLRGRHRVESRAEGGPWLAAIESLAAALPQSAVIAGDSAMCCYYGALSNLPSYRPRGFLYPSGGGTLGYGLPAGIGAKLAEPDTPVVVLQGDGGSMFTIAELATAAQLRLPLPVVIVDNGGYGEIRNEMSDRGDPVHAVALDPVDFASLAQSLGCHGRHIDQPTDLGPAVTAALAADRPTVLHLTETPAR